MKWTNRQTRRKRVALWGVALGFGLVWSDSGNAQELKGQSDEPISVTEEAERSIAEEPEVMLPWGSEHRWHYSANRMAIEFLDLTPEGDLIALQSDGSVVTSKEGIVWRVLFDPGQMDTDEQDPESLLLEVEANFGELVEEPDLDEGEGDDAVEFLADPQATDLDVLDIGMQQLDQTRKDVVQRGPLGRVWAFGDTSSSVLVSRKDGRWYTDDFGAYWVQLNFLPSVNTLLELDDGTVLLGTNQGLWRMPVGGDWEPVGNRLSDLAIESLAVVDGQIYAGTTDGLFVNPALNGDWRRVGSGDLAGIQIRSVLPDSAWEGGFWVATERGLYRSDDQGQTARITSRNTLPLTTDLIALDQPGHLLAIGDGAWESVDGGIQWRSLSVGLSGPEQWFGVRNGSKIWIVGKGGLAQLKSTTTLQSAQAVELDESGPPVGELLERALNRNGLTLNPLIVQRSIRRALFAPQLSITGTWERDRIIDADFGALTNSLNDDGGWNVTARLCYGQCGATAGGVGSDPLGLTNTDVIQDLSDLDVMVVGDQAYVVGDVGSYSAVAANVSERVSRYRRSVADAVTDLYFARLLLMQEVGGVQSQPVREQVSLYLEIEEVTARLDAYTDGYFSRALGAPLNEESK